MNDPQFVEAARALAERILKDGGHSDNDRFDHMAMRLLSRPLREEERPVVKQSLAELSAYYEAHADDAKKLITVGDSKPDPAIEPSKLASWTMLANELMNLDEVLNK